MNVCYFGIYDPNYTRSRVLIRALRENDVQIVECRVDPKEKYKYWKLFKKHRQVKDYDVMIVGFPGHSVMPLAKIVCQKPIIFDVFLSSYETLLDRKKYSPFGLKALKDWFLDWLSCSLADKIILDGSEEINYFIRTFGIKKEKFNNLPVSADDSVFHPKDYEKKEDKFLVHFHGNFIPLQGIEYIVESAKLLEDEDIEFNLVGKGQTYNKVRSLADSLEVKNINFIGRVPFEKVPEYLNKADVSLGIFGSTLKAKNVMPCKLYDTLACSKALITGDSKATRELLTDRENVLFCKMASGQDLARKILQLRDDEVLRKRIAENGYSLFREKLAPKVLGRKLRDILINS